jgi:hypothetical protein
MTEKVDDRDWHPSNRAEAEAWLTYESTWKRANVARSKFTNASLINEIASHILGFYEQDGHVLIAALMENPNLTPELIESLDKKSVKLNIDSQLSYWMHRYGVNRIYWSESLPRTFTSDFINS